MPEVRLVLGVNLDVEDAPNGDKVLIATDKVTGNATHIPMPTEAAEIIGTKLKGSGIVMPPQGPIPPFPFNNGSR